MAENLLKHLDKMDGNQPELVRLRRYCEMLEAGSRAVIAFGVWSIVKTCMYFLMPQLSVREWIADLADILDRRSGRIILIFMLSALFAVDMSMRIYVGRSAKREVRGKGAGWFYVIVAGFLAIEALEGMTDGIIAKTAHYMTFEDRLMSGLVDFTAFIAAMDVVISGLLIKKMRLRLRQKGE